MPKSTLKMPPQALLREMFDYDPRTGIVTRRITVSHNARRGDIVGSQKNTGHLAVKVNKRKLYLHRLIWVWMRGDIPDDREVDHDDGNPGNNAWRNLYLATHQSNLMNCKRRSHNTSSVNGVSFHRASGKWRATVRGKHLGVFTSKDGAIAAREAADEKYGFHETHGKR